MGKVNGRLEDARKAYRDALQAARAAPTPEAWARLLAAGKDLSAAEDPRPRGRRSRRRETPAVEIADAPEPGAEQLE